ncbi:iduronate 2-sulfatase isoform X2 [Lates japonicus]|uniref:Iduronate 2-sulfatase isoform X2 n=1 Tax=Lates japonicus TaxID=270547 RepID=A0AAD3RK42_LATJO|nr:iduronate 2-sulfatase isoform X2 [Lates japonicus]
MRFALCPPQRAASLRAHKEHGASRIDRDERDFLYGRVSEHLKPCADVSTQEELCTEGDNLAHTFRHAERREDEEAISFSQYPRPADTPQVNSDLPDLKDIKVMGYSLRSWDYRYTLWLGFNPDSFQVNVSDVHAGELYMLADDPRQDNNVYSDSDHSVMMKKMASLAHTVSLQMRMKLQLHPLRCG